MAEPPSAFVPTSRTTLRRMRERGQYDRDQVYAILDEGFICHVACIGDGAPHMIPTAYGRRGDQLLLHGAAGNHFLRSAAASGEITLVVTLVDGLVLARSTFHHSINYRSVTVIGAAHEITDPTEKAAALEAVVEHMLPGRTGEARAPTDAELRATHVLRLPLNEVSAKVRTGPPVDDPEDLGLACWAGVIPLHTVAGAPIASDEAARIAPLPQGAVQPSRWPAATPEGAEPAAG